MPGLTIPHGSPVGAIVRSVHVGAPPAPAMQSRSMRSSQWALTPQDAPTPTFATHVWFGPQKKAAWHCRFVPVPSTQGAPAPPYVGRWQTVVPSETGGVPEAVARH
jgi:hypothetical protein